MTFWQKTLLVVKVIEVRLRFVAILVVTALVIGYWDSISNYWDKWVRPNATAANELPADQELYCPMHPQVIRHTMEPNGDMPKCPICGMPLSQRKKGAAPDLAPGVTGRVQLSPQRILLAGVKTVRIEPRTMVKEISTSGNVSYDQSRLSRIVSRVSGYVEKLFVDKTYVNVKQGDPLAEIYSPELYASAQELLLASKRTANSDLASDGRQRLKLLGVSDSDIDEIVRSGKASPRMVLRAPQDGTVIGKEIVAGARVDEGMTLLEIADLSVVWIEADVFEKDAPFLKVGVPIEATVDALPGRVFKGKASQIYAQLDSVTRTTRVRFEAQNAGGELRPGMFASVKIKTDVKDLDAFKRSAVDGKTLAVPEQAVVDTGEKRIVYVERETGVFEGVQVELGPRVGEYYPVVSGLESGATVAAAGSFLIDAETRLNPAAASAYFGASGGPQSGAESRGVTTAKPTENAAVPATPSRKPITEAALKNLDELSSDDQAIAKVQKYCPITELPLGSMGKPVKVTLSGQTVFLCCAGCVDKAQKNPDATLKKVAELKQ